MNNANNKVPSIQNLRQNGCKVKVFHSRRDIFGNYFPRMYFGKYMSTFYMSQKGGKTVVTLTDTNNKTVVGESDCSKRDNFNRKVGIELALGRALEKLGNTGVE